MPITHPLSRLDILFMQVKTVTARIVLINYLMRENLDQSIVRSVRINTEKSHLRYGSMRIVLRQDVENIAPRIGLVPI